MGGSEPRFMFRAPAELLDRMKVEAKKAGITPSEFIRQSLEASIMWEWVTRQQSVSYESPARGVRQLGMRVIMPSGRCLHPPTAHEMRPFETRCGLCGAVVESRS